MLIVEMYIAMPKRLHEEKCIDVLLQDIQGFMRKVNPPRNEVEV